MISLLVTIAIVLSLTATTVFAGKATAHYAPASTNGDYDEAAIYTQYLLNGGYEELSYDYFMAGEVDISTCLIDIDHDGVSELMIHLISNSNIGVRGHEQYCALLEISGNEVSPAITAYYGGGTMGGDYLYIMYDNLLGDYVIALDSFLRDGVYANSSTLAVYSSENYEVAHEIVAHYYSTYEDSFGYAAEAQKIREKTNLYYEDGYDFYYYTINGEFVSKEAYSQMSGRFVMPSDGKYALKDGYYHKGTYSAPIEGYTAQELTITDPLQYFIAYCDQRYFSEDEVAAFTEEELMYARNAIFAKSGWDFSSKELKDYFGQYSWYSPTVSASDFNDTMLNSYQLSNRDLILRMEGHSETTVTVSSDIWNSNNWSMSAEQAEAYAKTIEDAVKRFDKVELYGDERAVYATLFDVGGNTALWIAGACIMDDEPFWHCAFEYGGKYVDIIHEEIWQWDGSNAVEFDIVSSYEASVNLWEDGIEVFTFYRGTDVDGEAWSAFYPFVNGAISASSDWCRAWAWVYDYKLEGLDVAGKSQEDTAEVFFRDLISQNKWPNIPLQWDNIEISNAFSDSFRADVTGGSGYQAFCNEKSGEYGYYPESTPNATQRAFYLEKNDGSWLVSEAAVTCLSEYADTHAQDTVEIKAYSAFPEASIGTNQEAKIMFCMYVNGELAPIEAYELESSNSSVLKSIADENSDGSIVFTLKGMNPGISDLTFTELTTNAKVSISIAVEDKCNYFRCSVFPVPYESIGGIYVADYTCTEAKNGVHGISFNAYNTSYAYGVVEVYDEDGALIRLVPVDPRSDGTGMEKVVNGFKWAWEELKNLFTGDKAFYELESEAKHTHIELEDIPENAEIIISSDGNISKYVALYTGVDLFVRTVANASSIDLDMNGQIKTVNELMDAVIDSLIKSTSGEEIEKTMKEGFIKEAAESIATAFAFASKTDRISKVYETVQNLFQSLDIDADSIMLNVLKGLGFSVVDKTFTTVVPAYKIVNFVDIILETAWPLVDYQWNLGRGKVEVHVSKHGMQNYIVNSSVRLTQQGDFSASTVLDAYVVTDENEMALLSAAIPTEMANYMVYSITLRDHGVEIQPNGEIEVSLPIPEGIDKASCVVYRVEESGNATLLPSSCSDGHITFATTHLSYYIVGSFDHPSEADHPAMPDESSADDQTSEIYVICLAVGIVVCLVLLLILLRKIKRK